MKILVVILLAVSVTSYGQHYEYLSLYQVKAGINDKSKVEFNWPNKPDSAKILNDMKLRDPLVAIQTMESKGFELYSVHEYGPGGMVIVSNIYMRRKKK